MSFYETVAPLTFWIIDDDILQIKLFQNRIIEEKYGLKCSAAFRCCEDAIQYLDVRIPPNIILIDISLPGISGLEGLKIIKQNNPDVICVMYSSHKEKDLILRAINFGASGFVDKNTKVDVIIDQLKVIIKGGFCLSSSIHKSAFDFLDQSILENNYGLSEREKEILTLLKTGITKKQIAEKLFLSFYTIDTYIRRIYTKLEVNTKTDAVKKAILENIV